MTAYEEHIGTCVMNQQGVTTGHTLLKIQFTW
jgi:hypothetical protein